MTKLRKFTEIRGLSAFPFSIQLMFDQTLNNLIVCLMISQKLHKKLHKGASMLQGMLGTFEFSQNKFEMRLKRKIRMEEGCLRQLHTYHYS